MSYYISVFNVYTIFKNILTSISHWTHEINVLEALIISDGLAVSLTFLKQCAKQNSAKHKLSEKQMSQLQSEIIRKCSNIYTLYTIDRYFLYFVLHVMSHIMFTITSYIFHVNVIFQSFTNLVLLVITIPKMQNDIMKNKFLKQSYLTYNEIKTIYVKYTISNILVSFIQDLHPKLEHIPNYNIFIIHNYVNLKLFLNALKNVCIVSLLNFLKVNNSFYYYYKSIKIAYSYHTGYTFNMLSCDNALDITNTLIKEKRWDKLSEIENVNALYVLIQNKFFKKDGSLQETVQLLFFKFSCIWNIISFIKVACYNSLYTYTFLLLSGLSYKYANYKLVVSIFAVYCLIFLKVNDLIITIIIVCQNLIYYTAYQAYFFCKNLRDIRYFLRKHTYLTRLEDPALGFVYVK